MLSKTDLSGVSLYRANMEYADLRDANNLTGTDLINARFSNTETDGICF